MIKTDAMPDLRKHFPDYGDLDFDLPEGFEDDSIGVEACPAFKNPGLDLRLYADYRDSGLRVHNGFKRFSLVESAGGERLEDYVVLAQTDSFDEIVRAVDDHKATRSPRLG